MDFDEVIDRRGTHSSKWDTMEELYGVSPDTGLSMWVADMDFRAPEIIQEKLRGINSHGIYGYYGPRPKILSSSITAANGSLVQPYPGSTTSVWELK